jgi:hypothetical protein
MTGWIIKVLMKIIDIVRNATQKSNQGGQLLTLKEIIHADIDQADLDPEKLAQCKDLLERMNKVRDAFGKPMIVTSGVRTLADHLRIYKNKGITDQSKIPMKSRHLETITSCAAVDIADSKNELQQFLLKNENVLEDAGLWCEDFSYCSNWVHFQNSPPNSGKRFFSP